MLANRSANPQKMNEKLKFAYISSFLPFEIDFTPCSLTRGTGCSMSTNVRDMLRGQLGIKHTEQNKKIDSPLTRYNTLGQLVCILCQAVVKSELAWAAHVQGKIHKDVWMLFAFIRVFKNSH